MRVFRRALLLTLVLVGAECQAPFWSWLPRADAQARRPQVVTKNYDVEVSVADDIKVRLKNPPARFDQKGQLLKYSAEELKELKGDLPEEKNLPGYKSDFADLKIGDIVAVSLVRFQPDPKDKDKTVRVAAGQLNGTVAKVQGGGKTLIVRVSVAEAKLPFPTVANQNKVTLDPRQFQAAGIMVLVENPRDDLPPAVGKGKSK